MPASGSCHCCCPSRLAEAASTEVVFSGQVTHNSRWYQLSHLFPLCYYMCLYLSAAWHSPHRSPHTAIRPPYIAEPCLRGILWGTWLGPQRSLQAPTCSGAHVLAPPPPHPKNTPRRPQDGPLWHYTHQPGMPQTLPASIWRTLYIYTTLCPWHISIVYAGTGTHTGQMYCCTPMPWSGHVPQPCLPAFLPVTLRAHDVTYLGYGAADSETWTRADTGG